MMRAALAWEVAHIPVSIFLAPCIWALVAVAGRVLSSMGQPMPAPSDFMKPLSNAGFVDSLLAISLLRPAIRQKANGNEPTD